MIPESKFPWLPAYLAAFQDTAPKSLTVRISDAMSALEQRQLSSLPNKEEKVLLRQAHIAMRLLLIRNESCKA